MLWPNTGVGNGTISGYTASQTQRLFAGIAARFNAYDGVFQGYGDECASTGGTASVDIEDGICIVNGVVCFVEAETVAVAVEASNTGFVIGVYVDFATQTGSLYLMKNTVGQTTFPDFTTLNVAGVSWFIPLCGGVVMTADSTIRKSYAPNQNTAVRYLGTNDLRRFIGDTPTIYHLKTATTSTSWVSNNYIFRGENEDTKDLLIKANLNSYLDAPAVNTGFHIRFNLDSSGTYDRRYVYSNFANTTPREVDSAGQTSIFLPIPTYPDYHHLEMTIYNAFDMTTEKMGVYRWFSSRQVTTGNFTWNRTTAISLVQFFPDTTGVVASNPPAIRNLSFYGIRR